MSDSNTADEVMALTIAIGGIIEGNSAEVAAKALMTAYFGIMDQAAEDNCTEALSSLQDFLHCVTARADQLYATAPPPVLN